MFRTRYSMRDWAAMAFVIVYLFSYANANMFWHCHTICGQSITHSHIYGKAHQTGHTDGGHTANGLILISIADQVTSTEEAVQTLDLQPLRPFTKCVFGEPVLSLPSVTALHVSLRGPPVFD